MVRRIGMVGTVCFAFLVLSISATAVHGQNEFVRGDANCDGVVDSTDDLFAATCCPDAGDWNDDGVINLIDVTLFSAWIMDPSPENQPAYPYPECGLDPSGDADGLTCGAYDPDSCPTVAGDADGDGIPDASDNCPNTPNPGQEDADLDLVGDSCDVCTDTDDDGYGNPGFLKNTCDLDNCPTIFNPGQDDFDGDLIGDACDVNDTLQIFGLSPIDLVVTDPGGDSIGIGFNTIGAGSDYDSLTDINSSTLTGPDGDPDDIVTIPNPMVGDYHVRIIPEPGAGGELTFSMAIRINGNAPYIPDGYYDQQVSALGTTISDTYVYTTAMTLPGDVNCDGSCTSADIIYMVNYIFKGGAPPDVPGHADVNCDGSDTSADIISMVNFVFKSGNPPCSQTSG